jgi:hypothetical protein
LSERNGFWEDNESSIANNHLEDIWIKSNSYLGVDRPGLSFPTCNPEKRIDYLFYRENKNSADTGDSGFSVLGVSSKLVGSNPTPETGICLSKYSILCFNDFVFIHFMTAHLVGSRDGMGMLDNDSPIWASDHLALVSDFQFALKAL